MARQLVVLVENRPGALVEVLSALSAEGINVEGIMIEGSLEFGTLRLHVSKPREAERALKKAGFQVTSSDVLLLDLPNRPGELQRVCEALAKEKINIECLFGTSGTRESAEVVLKVSDPERARKVLGLERP